jgi:antitoxin (DNA-binding transcriptional repressor) of toxin-antitoxin stability system
MYSVREAQANFEKQLRRAANGEEVIIALGKKPVAKLVAIPVPKKKRAPSV